MLGIVPDLAHQHLEIGAVDVPIIGHRAIANLLLVFGLAEKGQAFGGDDPGMPRVTPGPTARGIGGYAKEHTVRL